VKGVGSARAWRVAAAVLLFVLLAGNSRLILGMEAPQWDASDFFGPQFSLVADFVKHGRLLVWDPWIAAGTPDFAEPEIGTTSPLLLLIGLLSPNPQAGFIAYWLVLWAIGGIGMLYLARYLGSPAWGGLVVALGYVTSGFIRRMRSTLLRFVRSRFCHGSCGGSIQPSRQVCIGREFKPEFSTAYRLWEDIRSSRF